MKQTQLRNLIVAGTIAMAPVVGAVIHLTSATEPGFSSEPLRQTAADLAPAPASAHMTTANVPVTTDARIYGVLYGNNKFESSWICSIPVAGSPELQKHQGSVYCTYGGVYIDGYYYASNSNEIQKYDPQDWSAGKISATAIDKDTAFRPVELTYDVTTKTVWGAFLQPNSWTDKYFLGTIDLETGKATSLRMLDEGLVCEGMAADAHGNIYTIINKDFTEYWGNLPTLYKLDKKTGELTKIATYSTELPLGKACSATIDFATGKLYWMTDTYPLATLYEIDVTTGERTVVYRMPDNDRVVSIYIPYEITEDDAPALLNDLALTFTDTDGNATVTFTVPDKTHNGAALTSSVTYDITEGRTSLSTGSLTPGATASIPVKVSAKGVVKLNVALTANAKTSVSHVMGYAGADAPAAPEITSVTADNNSITVSWEAPESGVNGGLIDTSSPLTYRVVIEPLGTVVETSTTALTTSATLSLTEPTALRAHVTASCGAMTGETAVSPKFVAGPPFTAPWSENFETPDGFELFTVEDVAGDGATWVYSPGDHESYTRCEYLTDTPKDDWLFMPPVTLEAGKLYTLSFKASSQMTNAFPETLEVKMGHKAASSAMDITLLEPEIVHNDISWTWYDYLLRITVEETGRYYVGFHAMTPAEAYCLAIDDLVLQGAAVTAPARVTDLTATPAADASDNATVTFTLPTTTVEGSPLTSISSAEVYLNNRLVKTFENPEPESTVTVDLVTNHGLNTVDVICLNASGRGFPASTTVWTGLDAPAAPANFRAVLTDGGVRLTWDTPKGRHGGILDTTGMEYLYARYVGGEQEIIDNTQGMANEYLDGYNPDTQTSVVYMIAARNNTGDGATAVSNVVVAGGPAYTLPFAETFASGYSRYAVWENQSLGGASYWIMWNPADDPGVTPYDNDNGTLAFAPAKTGDKARLFSGVIDLDGAANPVLALRYCGHNSTARFAIEMTDGQSDWKALKTIDLTAADNEWKQIKVSVPDELKGARRLQIGLVGEAVSDLSRIYVDDITLRDVFGRDLGVTLSTRRNFILGEPASLDATVTNLGEQAVGPFRLEFLRDGEVIDSRDFAGLEVDETIKAASTVTIGLDAADNAVYGVRTVYDADLNKANDLATTDVRHRLPAYPEPRDLTLHDPARHDLTWTAPAVWTEPDENPVTDDFESYEPFIVDEIGDWSVYDEKGSKAYGLIGFDFPHRNEAKSWQVFNLWALGVEMSEDEVTWRPNSGHQMLVSMCEADGKVDDWLISPALTGHAQTISFYVRGLYTFLYDNEDFEVYASETGNTPGDFELIYTGEAPDAWTRITVDLPEGTRYFAIKCVSRGKFAMGLDDITYTPGDGIFTAPQLTGYNIYRNGVKTANADATAFSSTGHAGDIYAVTAVYDQGESRWSNRVSPTADSSIDGIPADGRNIRVTANAGDIIVTGARGLPLKLTAADGRTVTATAGASEAERMTPGAPGVYIVSTPGFRAKVIVR